jgi:hypothetical protein
MTQRRSKSSLPWLLGVLGLAVVAVLYLNMRGGGTTTTSPAVRQASPVPPAVRRVGTVERSATKPQGPVPAAKPAVVAAAAAPPTVAPLAGSGPTGRSDPFSPLAVPRPAGPPPSAVPSAPSTGLGLPLPPGVGPSGPGLPTLSPSASMTLTGIVGNQPRIAIIHAAGQTYVVGVGENVNGAVVVSIEPEKVVLRQNGVTFDLPLGGASS